MVIKEEGKSLVSDAERNLWNAIYEQATGYTDNEIAKLINGAPSTLDTLGEIAKAMADNEDVVAALNAAIGTKANQAEMESLLGTKLDKTGDSKDNIISFTSSDTTTPSGWTDVAVLKSGETHKNFLQKASNMFKNVRYLWKLCGSTDISKIGDGTITGALSSLNTGLGTYKTSTSNGNWFLCKLSSGLKIISGYYKETTYFLDKEYGNFWWASFSITLPEYFDSILNAVITPYSDTGLYGISITSWSKRTIMGFIYGGSQESKPIILSVFAIGA